MMGRGRLQQITQDVDDCRLKHQVPKVEASGWREVDGEMATCTPDYGTPSRTNPVNQNHVGRNNKEL